jgi:hypothetical protein
VLAKKAENFKASFAICPRFAIKALKIIQAA